MCHPSSEGTDPADWFSNTPPTPFRQIKKLDFLDAAPLTHCIENLEVIQFNECAGEIEVPECV